ncbi:MAG: HAD-IA family hydrolase [Sphaerochaetaceae bacterium]|jgi:putative hydrolase of the HAD superfamily|nr:HAD-IA family hydrolase [Sphaerochaetaceae bacterium]MDX9939308.1 HAD-IA family hydrolase [Sphaerochaetaceae bacterium]
MRNLLDQDLFIFDMGNVVIRDITTLEAIVARYGFDFDELHEDYRHYVYPLMDGTIDSALWWDHVAHQFGIRVEGDPLATFFLPRWNEPVVRLIGYLRSHGKRIVVGSNTYAPHWDFLRERGFLEVFDACYASHLMGICKPSKRFFSHILQAESIKPQKAFFLDDYEENVIAARQMGIPSHHYVLDSDLTAVFGPIFT